VLIFLRLFYIEPFSLSVLSLHDQLLNSLITCAIFWNHDRWKLGYEHSTDTSWLGHFQVLHM